MRSRDIAERINHDHHDEAERQRHTDVRYLSAGNIVDDNCPRPSENKSEGANGFGDIGLRCNEAFRHTNSPFITDSSGDIVIGC